MAPFVDRCQLCDAPPEGLYFFVKEEGDARVQALCHSHATLSASWDRYTLWRWEAPRRRPGRFPWETVNDVALRRYW